MNQEHATLLLKRAVIRELTRDVGNKNMMINAKKFDRNCEQ